MGERAAIGRRQLRLWGAQTGGALILMGVLVYFWRGHGWGRVPLGLGLLFALLGLTALPPARTVFRVWHALIGAVLWAWTRFALLVTYLIAVTPVALIGRLVGRDRLHLRFPGGKESYWQDHPEERSPRRYRRQF